MAFLLCEYEWAEPHGPAIANTENRVFPKGLWTAALRVNFQ